MTSHPYFWVSILSLAALSAGCESTPRSDEDPQPALAVGPGLPSPSADDNEVKGYDRPVAYIDDRPVGASQFLVPMFESVGGQVLSEHILNLAIEQRLRQRQLEVDVVHLEAEKALLLKRLNPEDEDQAVLMLRELREQRGLGPRRFEGMLRRNAALRLLVQDQVQITPAALRQAYRLRYGERYRARLIVCPTLREAAKVRQQINAGQSFSEMAVKHSTDTSAARGGLLPPISPADSTYPQAIRSALVKLHKHSASLSDMIVVDGGFALMALEEKVEPSEVKFDRVEAELAELVRHDAERFLMAQMAGSLVSESEVIVVDAALGRSWQRQKKTMMK